MSSTEIPLAVNKDLLHLHALDPKRNEFKYSIAVLTGLFRLQQLMISHFHFPTITESSLSHSRYSSPNNMAGGPAVAGDTTAAAAVWVASSCCRITHLATRHLFASQKQHLEGCRVHSNEEWKWLFATGCEVE